MHPVFWMTAAAGRSITAEERDVEYASLPAAVAKCPCKHVHLARHSRE